MAKGDWTGAVLTCAVIGGLALLYANKGSKTPAGSGSLPSAPSPMNVSSAPPSSLVPPTAAPSMHPHNYDERRGDTYYYIAAVSEEDRQKGRAVGSVSGFQYLGRNDRGEFILAALRGDGQVWYRAKCPSPCKIIDTNDGDEIAYSPVSIIGAAFEDAFNGHLSVASWAKEEAKAQRAPSSVVSPGTPETTNVSPSTKELSWRADHSNPNRFPYVTPDGVQIRDVSEETNWETFGSTQANSGE